MRIIAGEARGRRIIAPRGLKTRPPLDGLRESVFAILGEAVEGSAVLDLFAGAGGFGLEALSRGARTATFIEIAPEAIRCLRKNIQELGFAARSQVHRGDALSAPVPGSYDFIFLDPPFEMFESPDRAVRILERVEGLRSAHLAPGGRILLRHRVSDPVDPISPPSDRRRFGESLVLFFEKP